MVLLFINYCVAQSVGNAKVHIEMKTKRSDTFKLFSTMYDENEVKVLTKINNEVFETTITVTKPDVYMFRNYKKGESTNYNGTIYLEPGYDLQVFIDEKNSENPFIVTGIGSIENQILIKRDKINLNMESFTKSLLESNTSVDKVHQLFNSKYDDLLKSAEYESCSATFKSTFQKLLGWDFNLFGEDYAAQLKLKEDKKNNIKVSFEYINSKKEKINLASFRGKYVYIDLWTTHCAPCILEFPFLEKLKEKYKGKKIEFVSISLDKKINEWENYVIKHKVEGISLYCSNEKDEFMTKIQLFGVPRMLLIDPQGNIIDFKAKLPSDTKLIEDIDKLLLK